MIEPANYQTAIDALAKACVGLADPSVLSTGFVSRMWSAKRVGDELTPDGPQRRQIRIEITDTADATAHPASREELYEQAMLYFHGELAKMRGSPEAASADEPTPRDRVIAVARKLRLHCLSTLEPPHRFDRGERELLRSLEVAVDEMDR